MPKTVGVLGLQGDFGLHIKVLERAGVRTRIVRRPEELDSCDGLVLPGGESTTFEKLLKKSGLFDSLKTFVIDHGLMGTCAGLVTLSTRLINDETETLGLIDVEVERNAYGRQRDSFIAPVHVRVFKERPSFEGVFIRAPKIHAVGDHTEILATQGDDVVMARNERVLVTTFHPELTRDVRIHRYFIDAFLN